MIGRLDETGNESTRKPLPSSRANAALWPMPTTRGTLGPLAGVGTVYGVVVVGVVVVGVVVDVPWATSIPTSVPSRTYTATFVSGTLMPHNRAVDSLEPRAKIYLPNTV